MFSLLPLSWQGLPLKLLSGICHPVKCVDELFSAQELRNISFPISSASYSVISHLQDAERHFFCCTAPSPVFTSGYTAHALGCIHVLLLLLFLSEVDSAWCAGKEWLFSWSSSVPGTRELVSVLLEYSSKVATATCFHYSSPVRCKLPHILKHAVSWTARLIQLAF